MSSTSVFIPSLNEADKITTAIEGVRWATEVVGRLFHAGTQRCNLRDCPVWHLWHPGEGRRRVPANNRLLQEYPGQKRIRVIRGVRELEEGEA